jgi:hypothetical protein
MSTGHQKQRTGTCRARGNIKGPELAGREVISKDWNSHSGRSKAGTLTREAIINNKTGTRTSRGQDIKPITIID